MHSLFAESVCFLRSEKQDIKSFLIGQKNKDNYIFNESEITVLNKEAGCLVGYREGSIIRADCLSSKPLLLCINASWSAIDQADSYNLNKMLLNKEKIDWTKLSVNRNYDVRCRK